MKKDFKLPSLTPTERAAILAADLQLERHLPSGDFRVMAITPVEPLVGEAAAILRLLQQGVERIHLRHPGVSVATLRAILTELPPEVYPRLSLHDHHALALKHPGLGIHLNSRHPQPPESFVGTLSASCHSLAEVDTAFAQGCHYCFLSPVYDSISKRGYTSTITLDQTLRQTIAGRAVIALSGVRVENFAELHAYGFAGAAMLGAAWVTQSG